MDVRYIYYILFAMINSRKNYFHLYIWSGRREIYDVHKIYSLLSWVVFCSYKLKLLHAQAPNETMTKTLWDFIIEDNLVIRWRLLIKCVEVEFVYK